MGILRTDVVSHSQLEPTGGSIYLDGTGDYLSIASADAFAFGTGAFTFECWVNRPSLSAVAQICGSGNDNFNFYFQADGRLSFYNGSGTITTTNTVPINTWTHIALCREGTGNGQMRVFIDGVQAMNSSNTTTYAAGILLIGRNTTSGSTYGKGYISNLRITRTAEYTKNFTLPKFELENIPGTILLCCRSSSSVTASDITYATITSSGDTTASAVIPSLKKDITDVGAVLGDNTKFDTLSYMVPPGGTTTQRGRGRGFRFGGDSPTKANYIDYVNIQTQGTAQDFGDLLTTLTQAHGGSSSIRTIIFAGYNAPANVADIQYFTNATQGNSIDAGIDVGGDFTRYCNVVSSETRSVYGGGTPGFTATMEYVTNASLGSVTDFADFVQGGMYSAGTMNSSTRGLFAGGYYASPVGKSTRIQYITIATTADSIAFGDLTQVMGGPHGICSSPTRGIMWDGGNTIDYVTIATLGDGVDFGEATVDGFNSGVSFSSHTRACAGGGYNQNSPGSGGNANQNYIEYVTIASTGNAKDFGDLNTVGSSMGGSSDCHGGIS